MNLYLISQLESGVRRWDYYSSAVVAAPSEEAARNMHPAGGTQLSEEWDLSWPTKTNASRIKVEFIGTAKDDTSPGVICASFCAG